MNDVQAKGRAGKIALLNDALRKTGFGGNVLVTSGIQRYGPKFVTEVILAVRRFDAFGKDNDPYGERDFGSLSIRDQPILWKIDYYDRNLEFGSEDPADVQKTQRVLTIMLAEEY